MYRFLSFPRAMAIALVLTGSTSALATLAGETIPCYSYSVVARYPHDRHAFTQGLIFKDGFLYESTGRRGQSSVRKVRLETGEVLQQTDLPSSDFGEGLTDSGEQLLNLTWNSNVGYIFETADLTLKSIFTYPGEGWGLTRSPDAIFMSDGTSQIRVLDPSSLQEKGRINVTADGAPIDQLNELEWVKGEIFANIWKTDRIARINPETGNIIGWINLTGLLIEHGSPSDGADALNGIAYDRAGDRLFVTGKLWPNVFEIKLVPTAKGD
ncbi:glutaminyl-peptide cyclotransferase [Azotobacter armeniacus]